MHSSTSYYKAKFFLWLVGASMAISTFGGCAAERMLPQAMMPTAPKECEQVMNFKVDPLPQGKSNAASLSVAMAKEGATRQQEHTTSKVCAEYALRTAGVMKEKDTPPEAKKGVEPASSTATVKTVKSKPVAKTPAVPNTTTEQPVS